MNEVPESPMDLYPKLGYKTWLNNQRESIQKVTDAFDEGYRIVATNAPTATGKTLLGYGAFKMQDKGNSTMLYTCTTKFLQKQVLRDFGVVGVHNVKGKENYVCQLDKRNCEHCTIFCDYKKAFDNFQYRKYVLTNSAYFLSINFYRKNPIYKEFVVLDEADLLHNNIINLLAITVPRFFMNMCGIDPTYIQTDKPKEFVGILQDCIDRHHAMVAKDKRLKHLLGIKKKLYWVNDFTYKVIQNQNTIRVMPIFGNIRFWTKYAQRFLLMSATMSREYMERELGFKPDEYKFIDIDSNIPVERRPIYNLPVGNMRFSKQLDLIKKNITLITYIVNKSNKVIIHTVSKQLARHVFTLLRGNMVNKKMYLAFGVHGKEITTKFVEASSGILISPSAERGLDDVKIDTVIILKLGRSAIEGIGFVRMCADRTYYELSALYRVIQMAGRACRSPTDYGETYILDTRFMKNMSKYYKSIPDWFMDALITDGKQVKEALFNDRTKLTQRGLSSDVEETEK